MLLAGCGWPAAAGKVSEPGQCHRLNQDSVTGCLPARREVSCKASINLNYYFMKSTYSLICYLTNECSWMAIAAPEQIF